MNVRDIESTSGTTFVGVGEAMLRLATTLGERLSVADHLHVHVAGAEANVMVALAQLGERAVWLSGVPDSALGRRVTETLFGHGVEVASVELVAGRRLGLFFSDTGAGPRPSSVLYDRADSAFASLRGLPAGSLVGAEVVHITGITAAVAHADFVAALLAGVAAEGAALSIDVNYRGLLWDAESAREGMAPLLAAARTVVCAEADAREVLHLDGDAAQLLEGLAEHWAPRAQRIVLTQGADGCRALDAAGRLYHQPALKTTLVDRFGMGDAFTAGLLWAQARGEDTSTVLRAAVTLAALKATIVGDFALVTADELLTAMAPSRRAILR